METGKEERETGKEVRETGKEERETGKEERWWKRLAFRLIGYAVVCCN